MMVNDSIVEVSIMGRPYKVRCSREEAKELQRSAKYLDKQMRMVSNTAQVRNTDRIAVITALNIAHELLTEQTRNAHGHLEQKVQKIRNKVKHALAAEEEIKL